MTARIYLRVSRADESMILENQRSAALGHAAGLGFYSPIVYDETASGGDAERPGLGMMLRQLRSGDLVIFTSLSRMTRGGIGAALDILHQIERIGAGWHFVEQPNLNWDSKTPKLARDILLGIFAAIDEDYRRRISEATKNAFQRRKNLGSTGKWGKRGPDRKKRSPRRKRIRVEPSRIG